jgi:hypothetical protein
VLVSRYCDSQEGVERRAQGIVTDLVDGGYVLKEKAGRHNRYRIEEHQPLRDPVGSRADRRRDPRPAGQG